MAEKRACRECENFPVVALCTEDLVASFHYNISFPFLKQRKTRLNVLGLEETVQDFLCGGRQGETIRRGVRPPYTVGSNFKCRASKVGPWIGTAE